LLRRHASAEIPKKAPRRRISGHGARSAAERRQRRRLRHYARPRLLVIDEVGYLSYSNRHADLLFELVSRRYEHASTLITTNRPFAEWHEVFPNAACVVSLVDRLVHHAEILKLAGKSYRLKEAQEQAEQRARKRRRAKS
jgi:DNA replication protein DnaC